MQANPVFVEVIYDLQGFKGIPAETGNFKAYYSLDVVALDVLNISTISVRSVTAFAPETLFAKTLVTSHPALSQYS